MEGVLCASFKIKIEIEGRVKIVDDSHYSRFTFSQLQPLYLQLVKAFLRTFEWTIEPFQNPLPRCMHYDNMSEHIKKERMLCASFKIKIEFQGRFKIVDELKRVNI